MPSFTGTSVSFCYKQSGFNYFWLFLAHMFHYCNLAFNLFFAVLELRRFQIYNWDKILKNHVTLTTHLIYFNRIQNLATVASAGPEIWLRASKLKNGSRDPDHARLRVVCRPLARTNMVYVLAKFDDFSFSRSTDIIGPDNLKWVRPLPRPF